MKGRSPETQARWDEAVQKLKMTAEEQRKKSSSLQQKNASTNRETNCSKAVHFLIGMMLCTLGWVLSKEVSLSIWGTVAALGMVLVVMEL